MLPFLSEKIFCGFALVLIVGTEILSEFAPTNPIVGYYGGISYLTSLSRQDDRALHYAIFDRVSENYQISISSCPRAAEFVREHGGMPGIDREVLAIAQEYTTSLKQSYDYSVRVWPYILFVFPILFFGIRFFVWRVKLAQ